MRILIVGGDKRNLYLMNYFRNKKIDVIGFDMIKELKSKEINDIDISLYDIIIFPIDGVHEDYSISTKYNEKEIILPEEFLYKAKENSYIFSGTNSKTLEKMSKNGKYIKLLDDNDIRCENGIITSEGIIADIINNTDYSIKGSNIVVFGCGNVGKPLIKSLNAMNANVYVGVKDRCDFLKLNNSFYTNSSMRGFISSANTIVNTVPTMVLDKENLYYVNKNAYILDVSSFPYGIDFKSAKKMGLSIKKLPGLPGIVSPCSAAKILSKKIKNIVKEN